MPRKFKTKADRAFEERLGHLLREARRKPDPGPTMAIDAEAAERFRRELETPLPLDTEAVRELFFQYGGYLALISAGEPEPEPADA